MSLAGIGLVLISVLFVLLGRETTEAAPGPPTFSKWILPHDDVSNVAANDVGRPGTSVPREAVTDFLTDHGELIVSSGDEVPLRRDHFYAAFVDENGAPLAGARVVIRTRPAHVFAGAEQLSEKLAERPDLEAELFTDANGEVAMAGTPLDLTERIFEAEVLVDGYARQRYRLVDPGRRRRYRVGRPAVLSGRVVERESQVPVADIEVELTDAAGLLHTARSGPDGSYRMEGIAPGAATMRVLSADYLRIISWLQLESSSRAEKNIQLRRGGRLDVNVLDAVDRPVGGVDVRLIDLGSRPGLTVGTATTDDYGQVVFQGLRAGRRYMVAIDDEERGVAREQVSGTVNAPRDSDWAREQEIRLIGNWTLRGRAFAGPGGRPVPDAWVILESVLAPGLDGIRHRAAPVQAGPDGRFEVSGLIEGLTYNAMVYHHEFALAVIPDLDEEQPTVDVGLGERRRILGEVRGPNGAPVPFANVYVQLQFPDVPGNDYKGILGTEVVVKTDADGRYSLDHFPPGTRILIQAEDPPNNGKSAPVVSTVNTDGTDRVVNLTTAQFGQ